MTDTTAPTPPPPAAAPRVLDLLALERPRGDVRLPSGRTVPIREIDGGGYQLYVQIRAASASGASHEETVDLAYQIARRCIPEATDEEVASLTLPMVEAVISQAAEQVTQVEAELGNGRAPARTTPKRARPSRSRTRSATRSPA